MGPIDKYGAALVLSHSVMGLGTVALFHVLLDMGADISSCIAWLGLSESMNGEISTTASAVAGGACINSLMLPVKLAIFTEVVPRVAALMGMKANNIVVHVDENFVSEGEKSNFFCASQTAIPTPLELVQSSMQKMKDPYRGQSR